MEYECPQLSLLIITSVRKPSNRTNVLFYYPMLMYSRQKRLLWTLYFSQSKLSESHEHLMKSTHVPPKYMANIIACAWPWGHGRSMSTKTQTTSFLTATTLIYAIGAGITAAAGTRLALQWILVKGFRLYSFQLPDVERPVLLFIVTTSPCRDWVICAPAAILRCGSRFSGSLSGIEP